MARNLRPDPPEKAPQPDPDALRRFYEDRYSGAYMADHPQVATDRVRDVLSVIPAEISSILDYGCGRGFWMPLLHELFPAAAITGIDISAKAVERARSDVPSAAFETFDGRRAPYADGAFDLVFSFHVLEHVLDLSETLDDVARLVAPAGWVCLVLPCGNEGSLEYTVAERTHAFATSPTGELRFRFEDEGHLRRLRSSDLVALLRQRGLELSSASFGNHLWGAIEFIAKSNRAFIRSFADPRAADCASDATRLTALRALLLLLAQIVRAHRVAMLGTSSAGDARATVARLVRPLGPVLAPIVRALEALARREWRLRQSDPRGSAQYLVLRRSAGA